jgi:hypothetical protein
MAAGDYLRTALLAALHGLLQPGWIVWPSEVGEVTVVLFQPGQ